MVFKNRFVIALVLALVLVHGSASAQQLKIGFVNVGRLIAESPQAAAAMESLQQEFAPRQREVISMQNEFKEQQEQIQRDLEVMGADERRNAERDLRKEERELARNQQEFTEDINLRRNEELGKLQRELLSEVQTFARQTGYDLVVSDGVLFASEAIDITEQVLSGLKSSYEAN